MPVFEKSGLYRIHRGWAVNPRRIREIRLQHDGRDWEVVMLPPVNALPTLHTVEMIRFSFTGWADVDELEAHIAKLHTLND